MGRPKLENPRSEGVFIRLTKDEHTDITEYASSHDPVSYTHQMCIRDRVYIGNILRRGIPLVVASICCVCRNKRCESKEKEMV